MALDCANICKAHIFLRVNAMSKPVKMPLLCYSVCCIEQSGTVQGKVSTTRNSAPAQVTTGYYHLIPMRHELKANVSTWPPWCIHLA